MKDRPLGVGPFCSCTRLGQGAEPVRVGERPAGLSTEPTDRWRDALAPDAAKRLVLLTEELAELAAFASKQLEGRQPVPHGSEGFVDVEVVDAQTPHEDTVLLDHDAECTLSALDEDARLHDAVLGVDLDHPYPSSCLCGVSARVLWETWTE